MAPKAVATKHLDELSRILCPELQYFVIFSSVSCGRGNAGQSNYGMANSVMEKIIEQRHDLGLPAKAIQWGAVGEVGLVADMQEDFLDMEIGGTLQQRISSCLEELDPLLTVDKPLVASMVVAEKKYVSGGKGNILEAIMNIMSIRDEKSLSLNTTLTELGMDSLMTVEIQQTLEREHDLVISSQELRSMTLSELVNSANKSKKSLDPSEAKLSNQNTPKNIALLIRNFGDETNSDQTILKLKSLNEDKGIKTLIIPGIEGMAGKTWYNLAEQLNSPVFILQTLKTWNLNNLEEIFEAVIDQIFELYQKDNRFMVIGYSFGSLLAQLVAKALESKGMSGNLFLIDGSPKFIKTITTDQLSEDINEEFLLLSNVTALAFSVEDSAITLRKILSEKTWDERVQKFVEISRPTSMLSDNYVTRTLNAALNRMKLSIQLDLNKFPLLNQTCVTLIRPSELSVTKIEEDYGLNSYSPIKIDVKFLEGNHQTILDNPKLSEVLNTYYV